MSNKLSKQALIAAEVLRNGFLLVQNNTPKGFTVSWGRTKVGGILEPFANKKGFGHDLTDIIDYATSGMPGMTMRQVPTGRKEVFVDITGL
jgi:hypothetical protein